MRFLQLILTSCSLLLFNSAAQAQRPRCVDAKGFGYECNGSDARAAQQYALPGQPPKQQLYFDLNKLGTSQWEDSKKSRPSPPPSNMSDAPPIHRKPDPMDAWPTAIRSYPRH